MSNAVEVLPVPIAEAIETFSPDKPKRWFQLGLVELDRSRDANVRQVLYAAVGAMPVGSYFRLTENWEVPQDSLKVVRRTRANHGENYEQYEQGFTSWYGKGRRFYIREPQDLTTHPTDRQIGIDDLISNEDEYWIGNLVGAWIASRSAKFMHEATDHGTREEVGLTFTGNQPNFWIQSHMPVPGRPTRELSSRLDD